MTFHLDVFIILAIAIFSASTIAAKNLNLCEEGKPPDFLQYPFGFTEPSPIKLQCINGEIKIGEFQVKNITQDSILIKLPEKCNISIESILSLYSRNYQPTARNNLILTNCTKPVPCPDSFNYSQFMHNSCHLSASDTKNPNCFSQSNQIQEFETLKNNCRVLSTSVLVKNDSNSLVNFSTGSLSLDFRVIELEWWLFKSDYENAQCPENARAKKFKNPNSVRIQGFPCQCKEGFEGDGYGGHCRKVQPKCNPSNYMFSQCGRKNTIVALVSGIVVGAVLMAVLTFICYCIRRRSMCLKGQMSAKRLLCEATGNSRVTLYPFKEIERATNGFSENQRLGTGAFGTVYAGRIHEDDWVAVKRIKYRDNNSIDQVMNEIKLLSSVSHPNLVRLLGCCIEEGQQILVYEFMPNGTLSQHLQRELGNGLPWTTRLTIATETARAIAYLHSVVHPPIYHRDIKSSNILLDRSFKSKVADFGLSRLGMTEISHISTAPQGTPGYVDPQYHQNFYLSDKSDVYSFGVVLVEIITALKVVDFTRPQSDVNLAALAVDRIGRGCLDDLIDPFLEPHRDAWTIYSVHKVAELAFRCLAFHSDMRPSMTEVAEELESIRLSGWTSLDEHFSTASSIGSACSSPRSMSERSIGGITIKKAGLLTSLGSQRLIIPPENNHYKDCLPPVEEVMDGSPVSIHDPWLSEQSSPSTNSLLGNIVHSTERK